MKSAGAMRHSPMTEVVAISESSAVRDVGVVVVDDSMVLPVRSPVMPAPAKAAEESDSKANTERQVWTAIPNSWIRIPSRPGNYVTSVHHPRIVCRHIDHFRIGRLHNDCFFLRGYGLLRRGLQISRLLRTLAHYLHCIHYLLLLIYVRVAERRGPGKSVDLGGRRII